MHACVDIDGTGWYERSSACMAGARHPRTPNPYMGEGGDETRAHVSVEIQADSEALYT